MQLERTMCEGVAPDEKPQLRRPSSSTRLIQYLPIYSSDNYTPYFGLEFDSAVQDYCYQRSNSFQDKAKSEKTHRRSSCDSSKSCSSSSSSGSYSSSCSSLVRNCKVVVSGDVAVGKTCLVSSFGQGIYSSNYQTTIGVDFDLQRFSILGQQFVLQIWDTAGLERFRCITNAYYRGCQVALLVFDITNLSTLANVMRWKDEVLSSAARNQPVEGEPLQQLQSEAPLLFLVGTKCDLPLAETARAFVKEQANKVASLLQAELWFVSARTGENVQKLFHRVAALSFNRCILSEIKRQKFEASTLGACLKEKIIQHQKELWLQSSKFIKITKKKSGDISRSRCINIQCVIK